MFKKFDEKEDVTGATQLKSSIQLIKCKDHVELLADHNGVVQFLKTRNTDWIPTLRLLHKYPFMMPHQQASLLILIVDKGAIKFVLNGSSIMCPGLTSPGAKMTLGVPADAIVAVMAEGKQHALAIGQMKMSSEEIQSDNSTVVEDRPPAQDKALVRDKARAPGMVLAQVSGKVLAQDKALDMELLAPVVDMVLVQVAELLWAPESSLGKELELEHVLDMERELAVRAETVI
ncbi:hypothetical protein NECAME_09423 [Necator americanus]|uniref:PUA domain-containing protein n=2 Tax=Necator americanus TaxID=51031 RepID=W2TE27_NECAM|nr:hypothetical protein NECAME_09423 [Necator americanus]ETN80103.1 hypothetical protein NECAME_09423 [Necator americanus]